MSPGAPFNADDTRIFLVRPVQRYAIRVAAVLALIVSASYLVYRAVYTINYQALGFSLAVYFAEVHGFFSLCLYFHQVWALRGRRVVAPPDGLKVDVFITTYNEDVDLPRQTVRAAVGMRYPHRTCVLDDGPRAEVRALAGPLKRPPNARSSTAAGVRRPVPTLRGSRSTTGSRVRIRLPACD